MAESLSSAPKVEPSSLRLELFDDRLSSIIAQWVRAPCELHWLAPATEYPLTAAKVAGWNRPHGRAMILTQTGDPLPLGYAELNPMRRDQHHVWLGHVLLRPDRRGWGLGVEFTRRLSAVAFKQLEAHFLSLIVFPENRSAVNCYMRAGFTAMGYEYHRFGGKGPKYRLLRMEIDSS